MMHLIRAFILSLALALLTLVVVIAGAPARAQIFTQTTIGNDGAIIWRDWCTNGIPTSCAGSTPNNPIGYNPQKSDIRRLFSTIGAAVNQLMGSLASGTTLGYATQAGLFGNLTPAANSLATVFNDATSSKNGIYAKVGATGVGSWTQLTNSVWGLMPTISIGTVTILSSGSTPTVTVTGTLENPVFNFGIPQGPTGGIDGVVAGGDLMGTFPNPTINPSSLSGLIPAVVYSSLYSAIDATGATDSTTGINTALTAAAGAAFHVNAGIYLTSGFTIPANVSVICEPGAIFKRLGSATQTSGAALVKIGGSNVRVDGCKVDLNSPSSGNWWAGIAPTVSTSNVEIINNWIVNASFSGINYTSGSHSLSHTHIKIIGNEVDNSGWAGITVEATDDLEERGNRVVSTGYDAYELWSSTHFRFTENYATKATAPSLIYQGGSEGGMLLFLAPDLGAGTIGHNTLDDNRNAAQDGIGLGENGDTSSSSVSIGTGSKTFAVATGGRYVYAGEQITAFSRAAPTTNYMVGTVTAYGGGNLTMTVASTGIGGSGTFSDWSLNTEPAGVTIANNVVVHAGLFGIDSASNFNVANNRVEYPASRCYDVELDYGGIIRNVTHSGNSCRNAGTTASSNLYGYFFGANTVFNAYANIKIGDANVVDDRNPALMYASVGVNLANTFFQNVSVDGNLQVINSGSGDPFFTFGSGTDPLLNGKWPTVSSTLTWDHTPTGATITMSSNKVKKTAQVAAQIYTGSAFGTTPGSVQFSLPFSVNLLCNYSVFDESQPGSVGTAFQANGTSTATLSALSGGFQANHFLSVTGSCQTN